MVQADFKNQFSYISDNIVPYKFDVSDNLPQKFYSDLQIKFSGFHSKDFSLLSQTYFDLFPIIFDTMLYRINQNPENYKIIDMF